MLPQWNQEEWIAIVATVAADSVWTSSTKSINYAARSSVALPTTSSTDGAVLGYIARDKKGKVHMVYSCSS
jgi:predicted NAD/FAD-dependent oxidoreductase